jgi:hypothetical protein
VDWIFMVASLRAWVITVSGVPAGGEGGGTPLITN